LSARPFNGLLSGRWSDRQPLYGWRDSTSAAITQQLRWAHRYGIGFFVFDWYYNATGRDVSLNGALKRYRALTSHDGVGYALLYVNTGGSLDSFVVPAAQWPAVAARWVTQDFTRPTYERVDGKPLLLILDVARFNQQFGGPKGVAGAIETQSSAAADAGLRACTSSAASTSIRDSTGPGSAMSPRRRTSTRSPSIRLRRLRVCSAVRSHTHGSCARWSATGSPSRRDRVRSFRTSSPAGIRGRGGAR
jgi:hypothetical protein